MKASVQSAAAAAKSRGNLPGNLKTLIEEFVESKVPWEEELMTSMRARGTPSRNDWSRPHRRRIVSPGIYVPRRIGEGTGDVIVSIDTSGSVSDAELKAFISEVAYILSQMPPQSLHIIWCDAAVDRVDEIDSVSELEHVVRVTGVGGRGGTSFIPPFAQIAKDQMPCDIHLYCTDGYAPFPDQSMEVGSTIWLISSDIEAPFGKTIKLEV